MKYHATVPLIVCQQVRKNIPIMLYSGGGYQVPGSRFHVENSSEAFSRIYIIFIFLDLYKSLGTTWNLEPGTDYFLLKPLQEYREHLWRVVTGSRFQVPR